MAPGKRIGLIYVYNENWIGGTYYIQNLVAALNHLPEARKPELIIISSEEKNVEDLKKVTGYYHLSYRRFDHKSNPLRSYVNKISRKISGNDIILERHSDIDIIFPISNGLHISLFSNLKFPIFWIPDFQEYFMPDFFNEVEMNARRDFQRYVLEKAGYIVFSSESAKADFNHMYPGNKVRQYLLPFAVSHPPGVQTDAKGMAKKYNIPGNYFICSNQFWKHKNHEVILRAIGSLKKRGIEVHMVFTGKEFDHRFPHYFEELKKLSADLEITENIRFLGFIERSDQVSLMKGSIAVIQPSLFEGWSTVVEDSKAIDANLIVSDIAVHREQLQNYTHKTFFLPHLEEELADAINTVLNDKGGNRNLGAYCYENDIKNFANAFMNIMDGLTHD